MSGPELFCALYASLNLAVFFIFVYDKRMAENHAWRIPETILLTGALIGPPGAYTAMRLCRHKTRKLKFYLVPVFIIVHGLVFVYLARGYV